MLLCTLLYMVEVIAAVARQESPLSRVEAEAYTLSILREVTPIDCLPDLSG